jgi:hypothetical protein
MLRAIYATGAVPRCEAEGLGGFCPPFLAEGVEDGSVLIFAIRRENQHDISTFLTGSCPTEGPNACLDARRPNGSHARPQP